MTEHGENRCHPADSSTGFPGEWSTRKDRYPIAPPFGQDLIELKIPEISQILWKDDLFPRRYLVEAQRADFARSQATCPPDRFRDQASLPIDEILDGVGICSDIGRIGAVEKEEPASQFQEEELPVFAVLNPEWTPIYAGKSFSPLTKGNN